MKTPIFGPKFWVKKSLSIVIKKSYMYWCLVISYKFLVKVLNATPIFKTTEGIHLKFKTCLLDHKWRSLFLNILPVLYHAKYYEKKLLFCPDLSEFVMPVKGKFNGCTTHRGWAQCWDCVKMPS